MADNNGPAPNARPDCNESNTPMRKLMAMGEKPSNAKPSGPKTPA